MKSKLYINAETVIVNLLKEEKKHYLTIERLDELVHFIYNQLVEQNFMSNYQDVVFNVNFTSIERTVLYNNNVFELVGNTIYLKCAEIPESITKKYDSENIIIEIIRKFVKVA